MRDVGVMCLDCGMKCFWRNERTEIHSLSKSLMPVKHTYGCRRCSSRRNIQWKSVGWLDWSIFKKLRLSNECTGFTKNLGAISEFLGARLVAWSKFHTEHERILIPHCTKFIHSGHLAPKFVHLWVKKYNTVL